MKVNTRGVWTLLASGVVCGCAASAPETGDGAGGEGAAAASSGLERGQIKVLNTCEDLSLYKFNPAYHGTDGNPREVVPRGKRLIWQTLSGTPRGWATVLSAGQEEWGWRYCRSECLDGSW